MNNLKKREINDALSGIDGKYIAEYLNASQKHSANNKSKRGFALILAATTLAFAFIVTTVIILNRPENHGNATVETTDTESSGHGAVIRGENIPEWYAPGDLKLLTLSTSRKAQTIVRYPTAENYLSVNKTPDIQMLAEYGNFGEAETDIEIPVDPDFTFTTSDGVEGYYIVGGVGSRFVRVRTDDKNSGHYYCPGLYYDTLANEIICLNHKINEKLNIPADEHGIFHAIDVRAELNDRVFIQYYSAENYRISENEKEEEEYKESGKWIRDLRVAVCDLATGDMKDLPGEMIYAVINGYFGVFDNGNTVVFVSGEYGKDGNSDNGLAVARLDGQDVKITPLPCQKGFDSLYYGGAHATGDGKYLAYSTQINQNGLYKNIGCDKDAKIRILDLETLEYLDVDGRFIHFSLDGKYLIAETTDGTVIYNCKTGLPESAEIAPEDRYEVKREHADADGKYTVMLTDVFTGETVQTFYNVDAYTVQNGYIYMFQSEKGTVACRQPKPDGEFFEIPVGQEFMDRFMAVEDGFFNLSSLTVSADGRQILLYFQPIGKDTFIWNPTKTIGADLMDLPSEYWNCSYRHEALLRSILNRDESLDWRVTLSQGRLGYDVSFDDSAMVVDMLYWEGNEEVSRDSIKGEETDYSVEFLRDYYTAEGYHTSDLIRIDVYLIDGNVVIQVFGSGIFRIGDVPGALEVYKQLEMMYLTY